MRTPALRLATWNVHGFVGADRRRDPRRTVEVLRGLDADVIALQEVDGDDDFEMLGTELGMEAIAGPTLSRAGGRYGNLLLTRWPPRRIRRIDLSLPGLEPRGAIDVLLVVQGSAVRIVATHLGLRRHERARQARDLCDALDAESEGPVVLLGDLNEWRRPLAGTGLAPLVRRLPRRSRRATFPARVPLLALDRVLVDAPGAPFRVRLAEVSKARLASDHLPLRATLSAPETGRSRAAAAAISRGRDTATGAPPASRGS